VKAIGMSPALIRWSSRLGIWAVAVWSVLQLHEMPIAREHSICGPWGCGPTIPALLSAHGFWLLVAIPGALWAAKRLTGERAVALGWIGIGLGVGGIVAVSVGDLLSWPGYARPAGRTLLAQRVLFALATTVEVPLFPTICAGLILINSGRRRLRPRPAPELDSGCESKDVCGNSLHAPSGSLDVASGSSRMVGQPLPELTLLTPDGQPIVVPLAVEEHPAIFYFMRSADCSICRGHVRVLVRLFEEHHLPGVRVFIVQPGSHRASRALTRSLPDSFTITSGRDFRAYDAVGLAGRNFGLTRGSGTILVDRYGIVHYARLASLPFSAFSRAELVEAYLTLAEAPLPSAAGAAVE